MEQLDDAMIFYLAALPKDIFICIKTIFKLHLRGDIKGQKMSRSKSKASNDIDLKGSSFKCLRAMQMSDVHDLLQQVADTKLSMADLALKCKSLKQLGKIKCGFIKATNSKSWEEAQSLFPEYTPDTMLKPFMSFSFSGEKLPEEFMLFCKKAINAKSQKKKNSMQDLDDIAAFDYQGSTAILLMHDLAKLSPLPLSGVFKKVTLDAFL